jgi:hypothetical protein
VLVAVNRLRPPPGRRTRPLVDRTPASAGGNAGRLYNRGNPAVAGRARLAGGEQSPSSFIQTRLYGSVAVADTGDIDHAGEPLTRPVSAEHSNLPAGATRLNYFLTGTKRSGSSLERLTCRRAFALCVAAVGVLWHRFRLVQRPRRRERLSRQSSVTIHRCGSITGGLNLSLAERQSSAVSIRTVADSN